MAIQLTPLMLLNVPIFLIAASLAGYGTVRYTRGNRRQELVAFIMTTTAVALWQATNIFRQGVSDVSAKLLAFNVLNAVVAELLLYSLLWFTLAYVNASQQAIRKVGTLGVGHSLLFIVALILDPEFLYAVNGVVFQGPTTVLNMTVGEWVVLDRTLKPVFRIYQVYSYLLGLVSAVILIKYNIRNPGELATGRLLALCVGIGTPIVVNGMVFAGVIPPEWNGTDIALGVLAIGLAIAVFRYRLLDLSHVGRQQVVKMMDDPVVVLDQDDRVVDSNPAARELVDAGPDWADTSAKEFFSPFPDLFERFRDVRSSNTEINIEQNGQIRYFDLSIGPIRTDHPNGYGTLIVAREITQVKQREQELDKLRQVQSRVLRHNVRNSLTVVKGYTDKLNDQVESKDKEFVASIDSTTERLLSVSEKARTAETLIKRDQTTMRLELRSLIEEKLSIYRETYPSVSFALDAPAECPAETVPDIGIAIENLIENAAMHNNATNPQVEVKMEQLSNATVIAVSDNGPGIPPYELEVLESSEETSLEHGSGIGLWLVEWAVDAANATINYDISEDGTTATIRIPSTLDISKK